eukprot:TRINITY_DN5612_c0_g1_i1.p1 TRINITY_DN5612_c0_g1~~TRINITY_DN5612_c0_g1_i1.p1  ORF type:complete len:218 (+),score=21.99 TRINITY_DN5612_c0_g1_i1:282-935(+)
MCVPRSRSLNTPSVVVGKSRRKIDSVARFQDIIRYGQGFYDSSKKSLRSMVSDFRGDMVDCLYGRFYPILERFLKALLPELQYHALIILSGIIAELQFSDFCADGEHGDMIEFCELIDLVTQLLEEELKSSEDSKNEGMCDDTSSQVTKENQVSFNDSLDGSHTSHSHDEYTDRVMVDDQGRVMVGSKGSVITCDTGSVMIDDGENAMANEDFLFGM